MPKERICHFCKGPTHETFVSQFGGRFCSVGCQQRHDEVDEEIKQRLTAAGFENSSEAPNVWISEGFALTIEEVKHEGFAQAMATHRAICAEPKRAARGNPAN